MNGSWRSVLDFGVAQMPQASRENSPALKPWVNSNNGAPALKGAAERRPSVSRAIHYDLISTLRAVSAALPGRILLFYRLTQGLSPGLFSLDAYGILARPKFDKRLGFLVPCYLLLAPHSFI